MLILASLTTESYRTRMRRYLETIQEHGRDFTRYCGFVGCSAGTVLDNLPDVQPFEIGTVWLHPELGNPGNGCIQHGNFLPNLPVHDPDAVLILTDGDIRMQRPLTETERSILDNWPHGMIGIGPNAGEDDTLLTEAERISPRVPLDRLAERFWPGKDAPLCGNAGVLVARLSSWYQLWRDYLSLFQETRWYFRQIAVQQWTINLAIERQRRAVLPYSFHLHGHYAKPDGADGFGDGPNDTNVVTYWGEPVLFAHRCW